MSFTQINIPVERHPTNAAVTTLSKLLGFVDCPEIQDWERNFQNFDRLEEFVEFYEQSSIDEDGKFLLMELILASASDGSYPFFSSPLWQKIEGLLRKNSKIHAWSIWYWSCLDEESRIPYNDFVISPYMQSILIGMATDNSADRSPESIAKEELVVRFGKFWWRHFNTCGPVGYQLRSVLSERWVRFHSLPESKRYPDTERELREAIRRSTVLANEVLGRESNCWLIANRYPNTPPFKPDARKDFDLKACLTWLNHDEPLGATEIVAHAASYRWQPKRFEELLGNIARDEDSLILWVSEDTHAVFAPYDGGIDVILPDVNQATTLAQKHAEWLSPFPGGM